EEMSQKEAREKGAMALFSEKYGDVVRVVSMGNKSVELCGGTHVKNTADIGLFRIIKESSVAAGVRRIEAVTGRNFLNFVEYTEAELNKTAATLKAGSVGDLNQKAEQMLLEMKEKDKEIEDLGQKMASNRMAALMKNAKDIKGVKMVRASFNDVKTEALRTMGDKIKDFDIPAVAVLSTVNDVKASILVVATKTAVQMGVNSGKLVKQLTALVGGSGGGRPDSAMGGTIEVFKIDEIMAGADEMLSDMIK
ncbi:MAG: DHHA1 domain-containing protein, partial [Oscillospiraceae bacterium]